MARVSLFETVVLDVPAPAEPVKVSNQPAHRTGHDEKITIYLSSDELMELEAARLLLRGTYKIPADRGRIVRAAIAQVIAELAEKGPESTLAQTLRKG